MLYSSWPCEPGSSPPRRQEHVREKLLFSWRTESGEGGRNQEPGANLKGIPEWPKIPLSPTLQSSRISHGNAPTETQVPYEPMETIHVQS